MRSCRELVTDWSDKEEKRMKETKEVVRNAEGKENEMGMKRKRKQMECWGRTDTLTVKEVNEAITMKMKQYWKVGEDREGKR